MKFDPFNWQEIDHAQPFEVREKRLQLRASSPVAVYIEAEGHTALLGFGAAFETTFAFDALVKIDAAPDTRVFIAEGSRVYHEPTGEVFTNADRKPMESGSVLAVKAEIRRFQLEQRATLAAIRQEGRALAKAKAEAKPAPAQAPDPAPSDPAPSDPA